MPRKFCDAKGREWLVEINVNSIVRIRDRVEVDLLSMVDREAKLIERIAEDPVLLCNVLFVACQPEAEKRGITDSDFGEGLVGDAISSATEALLQALVDFFPMPRRGLLQRAIDRLKPLQEKATAIASRKLDELLAKAEKSLEEPGE